MSDTGSDSSEELSEISENPSLDIERELDADLAKEEKKDNIPLSRKKVDFQGRFWREKIK